MRKEKPPLRLHEKCLLVLIPIGLIGGLVLIGLTENGWRPFP